MVCAHYILRHYICVFCTFLLLNILYSMTFTQYTAYFFNHFVLHDLYKLRRSSLLRPDSERKDAEYKKRSFLYSASKNQFLCKQTQRSSRVLVTPLQCLFTKKPVIKKNYVFCTPCLLAKRCDLLFLNAASDLSQQRPKDITPRPYFVHFKKFCQILKEPPSHHQTKLKFGPTRMKEDLTR